MWNGLNCSLLVAILRVFCGAAELCQIHVVVIIVMKYITLSHVLVDISPPVCCTVVWNVLSYFVDMLSLLLLIHVLYEP